MHLILHRLLLGGRDVRLDGVGRGHVGFGDSERHLLIFSVRGLCGQYVLGLILLYLPLLHHRALGVLHVGWLLRGEERLADGGLMRVTALAQSRRLGVMLAQVQATMFVLGIIKG